MLEHVFPALSLSESFVLFGPRLLVALFCGGLIGLERELKSKSAGIKTNMLICVGSMLFTAVSMVIASSKTQIGVEGDPTRVAAQIVSGIGFLGGGAILQSKENVLGLTTAATIWLVAAIGMWIGMGQLEFSIAITILMVFVLVTATFFENRFLGRKRSFKLVIYLRERTEKTSRDALDELLKLHDMVLDEFRESGTPTQPEIRINLRGRITDHSNFLMELWKVAGVFDVKQL